MAMDIITLSFQIAAATGITFLLLNRIEKYLPSALVRTIKFGRASVGLDSGVYFFEVPKGWFTHFYVFAFTFSTCTLLGYWIDPELLQHYFGILLGFKPCIPNATALLVINLMWIQVTRRLYECLFISKFSKVAKMNILVYLIGHWHYFGAIISIFGDKTCEEISLPRIAIALPIFTFAWIKQLEAHTILGNLRPGKSDNEYKIPFGGLFEYVSCPNYFCEILIYISYAVIFGFQTGSLIGLLFGSF